MNSLISKIIPQRDMFKEKKGIFLSQIIILGLLSLVIVFVALPGYLTGQWSWSELPRVPEIKQMRTITKTELSFPGWETVIQKEIIISGRRWSFQVIEKPGQDPVTVALMPQNYYKDYPQVEWVDLKNLENWQTDDYQSLKFPSNTQPQHLVTAQWFQAWNKETYGVLQWYAWPGGGHYAPSQWFLADQKAQLQGKRVPWVVVSIKIPMEPLGNLKDIEPVAESLAETVQTTLEKEIFHVETN
ncbi:MAG: cyanoexosortase B system-associated protein [Cyanobacteria bacterium P01_G01_bin.49]